MREATESLFSRKSQFLFVEAFRLCHRLKEHHLKLGELLILFIAQASVNQPFHKQVCKLKACRMCEYIFNVTGIQYKGPYNKARKFLPLHMAAVKRH